MHVQPQIARSLRITPVAAPIREQVLANLRGAVLDGRFGPGQRLVERELCELTGASRSSVREALRQLESEGLVETVPNRGIVVARVSAKDAADLYGVRAALESLAARLFTERAGPDLRRQLDDALERIASAAAAHDHAAMLAAKRRFYDVLLRGADNDYLLDMLSRAHARVHQLRATSLSRPGRPQESVAELRDLVDAVNRSDAEAAARAAGLHVAAAPRAAADLLADTDD